jgi:Tfp pilus assembly protein PilF
MFVLGCSGAAAHRKEAHVGGRDPSAAKTSKVEPQVVPSPGPRRAGPTLSPAAASAYAAGLQAFDKADLKGAAEQFGRALAADRGAYPAHVGLGIIQERRGERAKALDSYGAARARGPA